MFARVTRIMLSLILLLGLAAPSSIHAEDRSPPAESAADGDYLLRPMDVLTLWVYKQPELTVELRVTPDGHLVVPVVGRLKAVGRGTQALAAEIRAGMESKLNLVDPVVSLAVKEYAPQQVYISGGVRTPRDVDLPLDRPMTLSQVVAVAGGLTDDALPAKVRIVRQRPGLPSTVLLVDYLALMREGRPELDRPLQAGDSIFVPQMEKDGVFVVGGVLKPGFVDLSALAVPHQGLRPITATHVLSLAGGLVPAAMPKEAKILRGQDSQRGPEVIPVDLETLITQGSVGGREIMMIPGDTLFVPQGQGVFVLGQVEKGGNYFPPPGGPLTVTQAISMAGGFSRLASTSSVRLVRKDKVQTVDVDSLTKSSTGNDPVLFSGDIIFVPRGM